MFRYFIVIFKIMGMPHMPTRMTHNHGDSRTYFLYSNDIVLIVFKRLLWVFIILLNITT